MARDLILGTAGHIDHGKTALVKALTGTDCDRLPEEKARGITIDIGFAQLDLGEFRLGVVDVPGHERFIRNMLAGATGFDLALLVVAADDSVMPQTREHLDILKLLDLERGVIAVTKCDLVDETTLEVVKLEIQELVRGSFLEGSPIVPTSARTGFGIGELKAAIRSACERITERTEAEPFRLAIDRAFVVQGHGTVVTGTVSSGSVRPGDDLDWHREDGTRESVRVRGLNNHGESVAEVHRGQRAAINLAGVAHEQVARGQVLATPGFLAPSRVLSVHLHSLVAGRPLRHRLPVRLHLGTADIPATLSLLEGDRILPGEAALAQLFLTVPVPAVWNQPFVVRDSSAETTLGGGHVLQPCAVKLRRRHIDSIAWLEKLRSADSRVRAEAALWFAGFGPFQPSELTRLAGIPAERISGIIAELLAGKRAVELTVTSPQAILLYADRVAELEERVLKLLSTLHAEQPLLTTHDRAGVESRIESAEIHAIVDRLLKSKKLVGDGKRIARADFKPKLTANQRKLKERIVAEHESAGFSPPEPSAFATAAGSNASALKEIFEVACAEGLLVKVSGELYLSAERERALRFRVREMLAGKAGATVAEIRDMLGTTRKYAVPLCEYLDRCGVTERAGICDD